MNNNTINRSSPSTADNNNSNKSSSSYTFPTTKSKHIIDTQTTDLQTATELECKPFFIDLLSLNKGQLDHLRNTGLLPPLPNDHDDGDDGIERRGKASKLLGTVDDEEERPKIELLNDNESSTTDNGSISNKSTTQETSSSTFDPYAIRLIRKAHISYLLKALTNPLSRGFVSLDASHTWMVYWCLHSLDLMGYFDTTTSECSNEEEGGGGGLKMNDNDDALKEVEVLQKADLLQRIVSTLEYCWTNVTLEFSIEDVDNDVRLKQLVDEQQQQQTEEEDTLTSTEKKVTITGGGFGGGNQQIPHCATSYAAVLSLSIVASLGLQQQSSSHPYYQAGKLALNVLKSKRLQMYAFFLTLRESIVAETDNKEEGGERIAFRMQHDGEIDVRASYCLLAPCYLLGLLNNEDQNNPLLSTAISRYIASCQTFEGGFGAEPFNEAHGGYTFCSLAALRILDSVTLIDVNALSSWLARRQMGYEGGFCGRTNKLVDGCYSFWQGGAVAVLDGWFGDTNDDEVAENEDDDDGSSKKYQLSYDELMLQRYILLCAQDVNGGLRDKPSKPKDFYHSCYNLSGLSVAQHALESWPSVSSCDGEDNFNNLFGDVSVNIIGRTDPVINIRKERVQFMRSQFT